MAVDVCGGRGRRWQAGGYMWYWAPGGRLQVGGVGHGPTQEWVRRPARAMGVHGSHAPASQWTRLCMRLVSIGTCSVATECPFPQMRTCSAPPLPRVAHARRL